MDKENSIKLLKNLLYRLALSKTDNSGHQIAVIELSIKKHLENLTK